MFYCYPIMTLAKITVVFICSFVSIKIMINNIKYILNKVNIKKYFLKRNKSKSKVFKNDNK